MGRREGKSDKDFQGVTPRTRTGIIVAGTEPSHGVKRSVTSPEKTEGQTSDRRFMVRDVHHRPAYAPDPRIFSGSTGTPVTVTVDRGNEWPVSTILLVTFGGLTLLLTVLTVFFRKSIWKCLKSIWKCLCGRHSQETASSTVELQSTTRAPMLPVVSTGSTGTVAAVPPGTPVSGPPGTEPPITLVIRSPVTPEAPLSASGPGPTGSPISANSLASTSGSPGTPVVLAAAGEPRELADVSRLPAPVPAPVGHINITNHGNFNMIRIQ